jgi:hypothetical protein
VHAGDGANERSLARAVRPDDRDDRSFGDLEGNAVERLRVAMEDIDLLDAQQY